jgi:nifR3 family TIM-barrel protein
MKIGNLAIDGFTMLAPMAGVTDSPTRRTAKKMGASVVFTEMVSATGLTTAHGEARAFYFHLLSAHPEERPLAVQIFGSDINILCRAAYLLAQTDADIININMGCPVPKVIRRGEGVALMKDPDKLKTLVAELRKAAPGVPLTFKMRSGFSKDKINAPELCRIAEGEGADALIIHPRTREQGFSGKADWAVIKACVESVKIPVIGNGDIKKPEDAERMLKATGCAGVMIGRAALGNPWLFQRINDPAINPPTMAERKQMILWHFDQFEMLYDNYEAGAAMRKQLVWYSKGIAGGIELRRNLSKIKTKGQAREAVEKFFSQ